MLGSELQPVLCTRFVSSMAQPQKCSQGGTFLLSTWYMFSSRGDGNVSPSKGVSACPRTAVTNSPINGGWTTGPRFDEDDDDRHIERVLFFASVTELASDVAAILDSHPNS